MLHRDIKPSNILLNANCDLKLCDFGLARGIDTSKADDAASLTEYVVTRWYRAPGMTLRPSLPLRYVVTRWYRAPEIMLSCADYTRAIDVWSAGCIFGEMLGRKPMFPGNDYIHQLKLIMKLIGTPKTPAELWFVNNEKARKFVAGLPQYEPVDLSTVFNISDASGLDLLTRTLIVDPSRRITIDEALAHPCVPRARARERFRRARAAIPHSPSLPASGA